MLFAEKQRSQQGHRDDNPQGFHKPDYIQGAGQVCTTSQFP
jgi:hypothetical protein